MKIVINDNKKSSNHLKTNAQRSKECLHKCKVCQGPAKHSNFGIMCCFPCKMFFKRNAETHRGHFTCDFGGRCDVDMNNRRICSSCRLTKCFSSGMKIELIRCPRFRKNRKRQKKKVIMVSNTLAKRDESSQPSTLNILESNQLILTMEQWDIISNLFDFFNQQSELSLVKQFIFGQNSLPLKLRFKCGPVRELVSLLISKAQLLFETNRNFHSLCSYDRSILLHRVMKYVAIISFSFISQQTHLIEYAAFYKIIKTLFGSTAMSTNKRANALLNSFDVRFVKLALAIICFSTFDHAVYENSSAGNPMNIKKLMEIQDMYIELAWRYLVYEYNEKQAIVYFSNLIKYIFAMNDAVILMKNEQYFTDIINSVIERTEETLTVCI